MNQPFADWVVRGSAILAVIAYLFSDAVVVWPDKKRLKRPAGRTFWEVAWLLMLTHTFLAMQFAHGWSLAAAYRHTAEQTAAVTGWNWGGGLVINFLLLLLWGVDVVASRLFGRPILAAWRWINWAWRGTVAFLMFNATVVFGPWYWSAIFAVCVLAACVRTAVIVRVRRLLQSPEN